MEFIYILEIIVVPKILTFKFNLDKNNWDKFSKTLPIWDLGLQMGLQFFDVSPLRKIRSEFESILVLIWMEDKTYLNPSYPVRSFQILFSQEMQLNGGRSNLPPILST